MARITAGVGSSHVPLLGVAVDQGKSNDDYFGPIFAGYEWTREWEKAEKPDVIILVYNDHAPRSMRTLFRLSRLAAANATSRPMKAGARARCPMWKAMPILPGTSRRA
jgi:hypothetical protein